MAGGGTVIVNQYKWSDDEDYELMDSALYSCASTGPLSKDFSIPQECEMVEIAVGQLAAATGSWSWTLRDGSSTGPVVFATSLGSNGKTPPPFKFKSDLVAQSFNLTFGTNGGSVVINFYKRVKQAQEKVDDAAS